MVDNPPHDKDKAKLKIPAGALNKEKLISMRAITKDKSRADFEFEPHGTKFKQPVIIELSYESLKGVKVADLILYYLDGDEWVEHDEAEWIPGEKKCRFETDHFSYYYYARR